MQMRTKKHSKTDMEIYLRDQAKRIFYSLEIPLNSLGVFMGKEGDWIYWYSNNHVFDTGSAETEAEAMKEATKYIKQINLRYDI